MGRTGSITPVAYFDPIYISGVKINKASLYNKYEIDKLDLYINDHIVVCRSGDVIPKVLNVIKTERSNDAKKVIFPNFCPECKTILLENKEEKIIRCHAGLTCNAQKKKAFYHFFSKKSLNVIGLGPKIINHLIKQEYVKNIIDFFYLTTNDLVKLDNVGSKKSIKIIYSLNKCKKTTFKRFIYALGIPNVGEHVSEKITNHFMTLENLINADIIELNNINGIGKIISYNILNYFSISSNRLMVLDLIRKVGIFWHVLDRKILKIPQTYFFNKQIVLTGVFSAFSRNELKNILINLGAKVVNYFSKHTDLLIFGKKYGSKLFKAKELNINIMNEKQLYSLINF